MDTRSAPGSLPGHRSDGVTGTGIAKGVVWQAGKADGFFIISYLIKNASRENHRFCISDNISLNVVVSPEAKRSISTGCLDTTNRQAPLPVCLDYCVVMNSLDLLEGRLDPGRNLVGGKSEMFGHFLRRGRKPEFTDIDQGNV